MVEVTATQVLIAGALDLVIGDPRWLPHPVRFIGGGISAVERILRRFFSSSRGERAAGGLLVLLIVLPVYCLTALLVRYLAGFTEGGIAVIPSVVLAYLMATTIATRELLLSVRRVVFSIASSDLEAGKHHVGMIVGRDTEHLDREGVLRAAIESLAENLSDGVVAPLLYLALGGLPLALAYKAINTLDSMVGYRNDRYRHFGWVAARVDDAANYLPARLTGVLIVLSAGIVSLFQAPGRAFRRSRRAFLIMRRDGGKHHSPNSGFPEAAMAGALGIRLGGPSMYGGVVSRKPFLGEDRARDPGSAANEGLAVAAVAAGIALLLAAVIAGIRSTL